jgi:CelD/BcsL family acetyltransferase involved in cellulose biosynthesis
MDGGGRDSGRSDSSDRALTVRPSAIAQSPFSARAVEGEQVWEEVESAAFEVDFVDGLDALRVLEADWRRIVESDATDNPFLVWEWTFSWAEIMMSDRLTTAVVRRLGEVVAIAPFYRNNYWVGPGIRARCLQLYGPRELQSVFEIRQIPMVAGYKASIIRSLLECLSTAARWDWVEVAAYGPEEDAWRDALKAVPTGLQLVAEDSFPVPILQLRETWEQQRSALRRNVKERIRRGYNSLKRDGATFKLIVDTDASRCAALLAEFQRLHELRARVRDRKAHVNNFRNQKLRMFLVSACERLMRAGVLSVASLDVNGTVVATRLVLERRASLYLYYSGFEPKWWGHSVMTVLVTELVMTSIKREFASVNFSPGLDQFKSGWTESNDQLRTVSFLLGRQTPGARLRVAAFRHRKRVTWALRNLARHVMDLSTIRPRAMAPEGN